MLDSVRPNPSGFCMCGCGGQTSRALRSSSRLGWVKGEHIRFLPHHFFRKPLDYAVDEATGCWVWQGGRTTHGYGRFRRDGVRYLAHRWYYQQLVGPIPEGLHLDHLCRNPLCVNPDHLEPVTCRENILRGVGRSAVNARKTECANGHPFDDENTYIRPGGSRACRACNRDRNRAYDHRKRAEASP